MEGDRAVSESSPPEWLRRGIRRPPAFPFNLSGFLNEDSRDSGTNLLGLDAFGDPLLNSRACLFAAGGATSMLSEGLLPEACEVEAVLMIFFSSTSEPRQFSTKNMSAYNCSYKYRYECMNANSTVNIRTCKFSIQKESNA